VRNILIVNERRGRITAEGTTHFLNQLAELDIRVVPTIDDAVLLRVARELRLSVYDASYLALAMERQAVVMPGLAFGLPCMVQRIEKAAWLLASRAVAQHAIGGKDQSIARERKQDVVT